MIDANAWPVRELLRAVGWGYCGLVLEALLRLLMSERSVVFALAARGHEAVGLGIHRSAEVLQGVRHVDYRVVPPDPAQPRDHPLAEWSSKVARGERGSGA